MDKADSSQDKCDEHSECENIRKEFYDALEQRIDVETIANMVSQLSFADDLSKKLQSNIGKIIHESNCTKKLLQATQMELRSLYLDVELIKRSLVSLGQIGVIERKKIEKDLILDLFPPGRSRPGMGIAMHRPESRNYKKADCVNRWPICKGACCRIFNVYLSPEEISSGEYEWDTRRPYTVQKNQFGCVYLRDGGCACSLHDDSRPVVCSNWSCSEDRRIWIDYDKKILNPELAKRLVNLDVDTSPDQVVCKSYKVCKHEESNGATSSNQPYDNSVSPPDFTDLKAMLIPEPENKFVPEKA